MKSNTRRGLLTLSVLLLSVLACANPAPSPEETQWQTFTKGAFEVDLPAWDATDPSDEGVIYAVSNGTATFWIKSWPFIPRMVSENMRLWTDENPQANLVSESSTPEETRLEMTIKEGANLIRLHNLLLYCDAVTYEVTTVIPDKVSEQYLAIADQALDSAHCEKSHRPEVQSSGVLGMVVMPQANEGGEFNLGDYQQALSLARSNGVQLSHYYVQWGEIEKSPGVYDWTVPDYVFEATYLEDLQLSVVVNVIHTSVIGRVPPDLEGVPFDDPAFATRLSQFLATFADRYAGRLNYLSIGNEVNIYFGIHRDEIEAYAAVFDQARAAIHQHQPDLPVGMVFAYHDAERQGTLDVVQTLNRGDFIAFTLYLYNEGFRFTRPTSLIGEYLDKMLDLAGETPMAVVEIGWSTADSLEGTEADQAEYVHQVFSGLKDRKEDIRFISWFILHDTHREGCYDQALTFFEPGLEPDPASMDTFVTFLCHFGLRHADGTPKQAWDVWVQEVQEYYK